MHSYISYIWYIYININNDAIYIYTYKYIYRYKPGDENFICIPPRGHHWWFPAWRMEDTCLEDKVLPKKRRASTVARKSHMCSWGRDRDMEKVMKKSCCCCCCWRCSCSCCCCCFCCCCCCCCSCCSCCSCSCSCCCCCCCSTVAVGTTATHWNIIYGVVVKY